MTALLEAESLTKRFRGLVANDEVSFRLDSGEVRCVIGPNGAGKTTFISMVSGHLRPTSGRVLFKGRDITRLSVIERARVGIARKFQTPTIFENLTTFENLELAVLRRDLGGRARERAIDEILELIRLGEERETRALGLSHGQRQWLEIGLLLGISAELLLLDEPTAGMTAEETAATGRLVRELAEERNLSVIIIEHDIHFIRELAAPITVLHLGRVLREGSYDEIAADSQVRQVYLGGEAHA